MRSILFSSFLLLFFSCRKDDPLVLSIPKEIHIKQIFVSNIPLNAPDGNPWDEGSTADIFLSIKRFSGGDPPVVDSDIIFDIDHSAKTEIPLDSTVVILEPEIGLVWDLAHWNPNNILEPKKVAISFTQFKFPLNNERMLEPFTFKSYDGTGKNILLELELQYFY